MHAAITIRFAASRRKPASLYAHGNTRWQQSCSLSNAICNHRFKKRIEVRTQEQPLVAEHRGGTHYARNDRSRNRRTHEVPFIAGCSHFTRKNTRFRSPASSPKQSPCNIHAAITILFAASRSGPASLFAHGNTRWQQSYSHYTNVILCGVKSHTTVSHHPSLSVLLCDVKSHTTVSHHPSLSVLLQVKVVRNLEDCFPTSLDK